MSAECYPISVLPHISKLYAAYLALGEAVSEAPLRSWYGAEPTGASWMGRPAGTVDAAGLADALQQQIIGFGAGDQALAHVQLLREGARAVVTGQQVGLLGGPLLTLLKAATAIARAREATRATGVRHVPVFWCATEDHDLAEVDQVTLLDRRTLEKLRLGLQSAQGEVGSVPLGDAVLDLLDQASEMLSHAPICDLLRECYTPANTLGGAFATWMTRLFAAYGLIVIDASGRAFHRLGQSTLRAAIEWPEELDAALLERSQELEAAGFHAQVLVKPGTSLLFLLDETTGERVGLRFTGKDAARAGDGEPGSGWKAGTKSYTTAELLQILDTAPERLSPNALLRPIYQDTILPTAAYIGGPAEIAYFAQSALLYQRILGRLTPILPRFSATLVEPAMGDLLAKHAVTLEEIFSARTVAELTQRLGARAMPIQGKRNLAAVGNAMDAELTVLLDYLRGMDASLGRSAEVSARKMRYQMNRLRRMGASFEVQKEASLNRHATTLMLHLFPDGHPQERVIAGAWFLAQCGEELIGRLVLEAEQMCVGHGVVRL